MTIMIVDDNASMRKAIRGIVAQPADTVIECTDGMEALGAFEHHHPDWVLMDIQMPGLDGISAMKKIRASDPVAHIIVVTEFDTESFRAAARRAGAHAYVSKDNLFELSDFIHH